MNSASYAPFGSPTSFALGNGLTETSTYNKRLQPNNQKVAGNSSTLLNHSYSFYDASNHNNGNVVSIADNLVAGRTQNFTYDSLNRLYTAQTSGTSGPDCWGQQYGYDAWGNWLTATSTIPGCATFAPNWGVNTKNQITNTGFSYDAAGNLRADATNTYSFDAENHLTALNSGAATYTYDAQGRRMTKKIGSTTTEYIYFNGDVLAEYNLGDQVWSDYIFAGGRRLASAGTDPTGLGVRYYHADHLGSARLMTDASGNQAWSATYLPFGQEWNPQATTNHYKFTGKERDAESGLDEFGARYYSSSLGRFTIPDWTAKPTAVPYADFANPQSFNLYGYAKNNPVSNADPDGHCDGSCVLSLATWAARGVARDGSPKAFAKNVGIGTAKGVGTFAYNAAKSVDTAFSSMGNPAAGVAAAVKPGPAALQPSNQTQAQASAATQVALTVASVLAPSVTSSANAGQVLTEGMIYRAGGSNPANLTTRAGEDALSFRNSLSDPIGPDTEPVFTKDEYISVDASKLPEGSAVLDNDPEGHVSVTATPEQLKNANITKGKLPKPPNQTQ